MFIRFTWPEEGFISFVSYPFLCSFRVVCKFILHASGSLNSKQYLWLSIVSLIFGHAIIQIGQGFLNKDNWQFTSYYENSSSWHVYLSTATSRNVIFNRKPTCCAVHVNNKRDTSSVDNLNWPRRGELILLLSLCVIGRIVNPFLSHFIWFVMLSQSTIRQTNAQIYRTIIEFGRV